MGTTAIRTVGRSTEVGDEPTRLHNYRVQKKATPLLRGREERFDGLPHLGFVRIPHHQTNDSLTSSGMLAPSLDSAQVAAIRFALGPPSCCGDGFQRLFRHHLFEPPVFVFQLGQRFHITDFEPSTRGPPLIKRGVRNAVRAAEHVDAMPACASLAHSNHLFLGVSCPYHGSLRWSPSQHWPTPLPTV